MLEQGYPPLIIGETAAAETIAGQHRIVTRVPVLVVLSSDNEARRRLLTDNAYSVEGPFLLAPAHIVNHAKSEFPT